MAADSKSMLFGDFIAELYQLFALKFEQSVAFDAVEVIVLGISIVVLVNAASVQFKTAQQSSVDKFLQCAVDSWATDVVGVSFAR